MSVQPSAAKPAAKKTAPSAPAEQKQKSVYETLSAIDFTGKVEKKQNLTYLSWAHAWDAVKRLYPDASYKIGPTDDDPDLGFMCHTSVTIQGETLDMWLPVMDASNMAMKREAYKYRVNKWANGVKKEVEMTCEAASMFDINKTMMRCLVKNLAMFGLGIHIYAGEDLPLGADEQPKVEAQQPTQAKGQTAPQPAPAPAQEQLVKDSDGWKKIVAYVNANKATMTFEAITKQIYRKYAVSPVFLTELKAEFEKK